MLHSQKLRINSPNYDFFESVPMVYFDATDGRVIVEQVSYQVDGNYITYVWNESKENDNTQKTELISNTN